MKHAERDCLRITDPPHHTHTPTHTHSHSHTHTYLKHLARPRGAHRSALRITSRDRHERALSAAHAPQTVAGNTGGGGTGAVLPDLAEGLRASARVRVVEGEAVERKKRGGCESGGGKREKTVGVKRVMTSWSVTWGACVFGML